jgi:putative tryptophan/tyrosine transport system substrate-binding protein
LRHRCAAWIVGVALGVLGVPIDALAQPSAKVYRIGYLGYGSAPSATSSSVGDFQQGLRDIGYVEGRNVAVEYRYGRVDQLAELAAGLVRASVDVIVTSGEPAALAAKRATKSVPIVATEFAVDPVKGGLVASLGRPEGNLTGLATQSEELWQKRLALLREIAPKLNRVAVLWNPANPSNASCVEEIKAAAAQMGMQVRAFELTDAKTLEGAFANIAKEPPDAIASCWDGVTLGHARAIAEFALRLRVPTVAAVREYVQAGSLLSIGTSLSAQRRRSAHYVAKILKGAKPADLPMERPVQFDLVINLNTAKSLGVALPPTLLVLADELIQ